MDISLVDLDDNEKGYVTILINRDNGHLYKIKFISAAGDEEDDVIRTPRKHDMPVEMEALKVTGELKVLDSLMWWHLNPTCVGHNGYVV
jgi:hypothetical protein